MRDKEVNSKRLARNTAYVYMRLAIVTIIALYASRVLLQTLGVEDYGVYNLVGSVIAIVNTIKAMFSDATQRFLAYELGRDNTDRLRLIFSMSIKINIIVAIVFIVIVEILGIWFLNNKINISADRLTAAEWTFHLSVISSAIVIMTSSYSATIVAHEHMGFFALTSIIRNGLNLIMILLIPLFDMDYLIVYAVMTLLITIIMRIITSEYCKRHFDECNYDHRLWDKSTFRDLYSFSFFQFMGGTAFTINSNGINMLLNVYGGAVANAARGIAYQVSGAVYAFIGGVNTAIVPYSVKQNAAGNADNMYKMFYFSSKVFSTINFCLSLPMIVLAPSILSVWLGVVPDYAVLFVRMILVREMIRATYNPIDTLFKAVGDIKFFKILDALISISPIFVSYIFLKNGAPIYSVFVIMILCDIIDISACLILAKKKTGVSLSIYVKKVLMPQIINIFVATVIIYLSNALTLSLFYQISIVIFIDIIAIVNFYVMSLDNGEKQILQNLMKK